MFYQGKEYKIENLDFNHDGVARALNKLEVKTSDLSDSNDIIIKNYKILLADHNMLKAKVRHDFLVIHTSMAILFIIFTALIYRKFISRYIGSL